ncbi:hypothetical protein KDW_37790 [Dictyobacter vulcani]|uniref:Uncharacterized protein n=1 Tax=Dictyobacter vulcani TaxID=2607529 RepID=A0A5J4KT74_9CHLR|nr:hypothetical protein KDW_37790 [Dictyobacter vulcani]
MAFACGALSTYTTPRHTVEVISFTETYWRRALPVRWGEVLGRERVAAMKANTFHVSLFLDEIDESI